MKRNRALSVIIGTSLVCVATSSVVGAPALAGQRSAASAPVSAAASTALSGLAERYLSDRADQMLIQSSLSSQSKLASVPLGSAMASATASDAVALSARRAADHAGGVDFIRADVQLRGATVSPGPGGTVVLHVVDDTKLYFKPVPGAPPYEESVAGRTFTFSGAGAAAQLLSQRLDDLTGLAPTTDVVPSDAAAGAAPSAPSIPPGTASTVRPPARTVFGRPTVRAASGGYNYSAMVNFETTYWNGMPTSHYLPVPNNCTNFLSYALAAGGWSQVGVGGNVYNDSNWYVEDLRGTYGFWSYSHAWTVASEWNNFARNTGRVGVLSNIWYTALAGVIQVQWHNTSQIDHTMMVTAVDGNNGHYMTYETNNTLNRPLIDIVNTNPGSTWYADRT